jgi:hypothetical protein
LNEIRISRKFVVGLDGIDKLLIIEPRERLTLRVFFDRHALGKLGELTSANAPDPQAHCTAVSASSPAAGFFLALAFFGSVARLLVLRRPPPGVRSLKRSFSSPSLWTDERGGRSTARQIGPGSGIVPGSRRPSVEAPRSV